MLFLVALTGGLMGTLAIVKALFLVEFKQLSVVVLLQKLQPVFAILLAAILLKERLTGRFVAWAAAAITGGYLLTFGLRDCPISTGGDRTLQAAIFALDRGRLLRRRDGLRQAAPRQRRLQDRHLRAVRADLGSRTRSIVAVTGVGLPFAIVTPANWIVILVISLTTGSGAIFLYYWGLTRVKATVATICELCLPLSAVHPRLRRQRHPARCLAVGRAASCSSGRS